LLYVYHGAHILISKTF